jgi:hypothetical protein
VGRVAANAPLVGLIERIRRQGLIGSPASLASRLRPFEANGVSRLYMQNFDFADPTSVALIGELARALA